MVEQFTVEEINLICIFDTESKAALSQELLDAIPHFDEPELVELAENLLHRLDKMDDAEFATLSLFPEYEDYYEESEEV